MNLKHAILPLTLAFALASPLIARENAGTQALFHSLYSREAPVAASTEKMTAKQLLAQVASLSEAERESTVAAWLQGNKPRIDVMENLTEALRILHTSVESLDRIVAVYGQSMNHEFTEETLQRVLNLYSPGAFAADSFAANGPANAIAGTITKRNMPVERFEDLMIQMSFLGMHEDVRDGELIPAYVAEQGRKLEFRQLKFLIRLMSSRSFKSQAAGECIHFWTMQNAGELMKAEVREQLTKLLYSYPSGARVMALDSLSAEQKTALLESEWHLNDLFFPVNSSIKAMRELANPQDYDTLAQLLVERNAHRLENSHQAKILRELKAPAPAPSEPAPAEPAPEETVPAEPGPEETL